MLDDAIVIDAVAHGYELTPANDEVAGLSEQINEYLYYGGHQQLTPKGHPEYLLPFERYRHADDADLVGSAFFAESPTDVIAYHEVPAWGIWRDGGSPMRVGRELRERYGPERVLLYGGVSPFQPDALDVVDRLVDQDHVAGLKLYPMDVVDGQQRGWTFDDPELVFPILERARDRGVRTIAVHKAVPFGPVRSAPFRVEDVEAAAAAFPDLVFEVVHGGMAFVEETAWMLARFPNVWINLEGTGWLIANRPAIFAQVLATFLGVGAAERIVWATGGMACHPRPYTERMRHYQLPEQVSEALGVDPLTEQVRRDILGENFARLHGLDVEAIRDRAKADGRTDPVYAEPWSGGSAA